MTRTAARFQAALIGAAALGCAGPAMAMAMAMQHEHHMAAPAPASTPPSTPTPAPDPHAGHRMSAPTPAALPAPPPPTDHAADAIHDPAAMARARAQMRHHHGGGRFSLVQIDLAEWQAGRGGDGYRWAAEGWFGGDIQRLAIKTEGGGAVKGGDAHGEVQALYSRAIDPYWNLQAGVRQDFRPGGGHSYATLGVEGLAPYWFELGGALFLSDKGDLLGRVEAETDQRITRRLILQPRLEAELAARDRPAERTGAGLSRVELGLRLRYEIRREFAPYIGVSHDRAFGQTARYARADGDKAAATRFVMGIRAWF